MAVKSDSESKNRCVFFQPWKGRHYSAKKVRLSLLGESHHGTDPEPGWTVDVVQRYIANREPESWFKTFTNIAQVVTGRRYSEIGRLEFWNSVAFYNYVQEVPAAFARGERPSRDMFTRS